MWEVIAANKRKSIILFIGMACILLLLGFGIGEVWFGRGGGASGLFIASVIWILMTTVSLVGGPSILLAAGGAKEATRAMYPRLYNVTEEMKIASGLPFMPKIYVIDDPALNAFATGLKLKNASIAVTSGLLQSLDRDELQGVVAHEMGHILNRDILYMTLAGIMLGGIQIVAQVFLRSLFFSGRSRYRAKRSGGGGGGQAQAIWMILALVFAILGPILARVFYFSISRKREYLADATAARLTRYPEGIAAALEKISKKPRLEETNSVVAPMFIAAPLKAAAAGEKESLFSTHPPIQKRVKILRSMAGGADYAQYERALAGVAGASAAGMIPPSAIKSSGTLAIQKPRVSEATIKEEKTGRHGAWDLARAMNRYAFLICACGMKMKIPPGMKQSHFDCPKCSRKVKIPQAEMAAILAAGATVLQVEGSPKAAPAVTRDTVYHRKTKSWESFECRCSKYVTLSPALESNTAKCAACGILWTIKDG